jgi:hypothetical protein
LYLIALPVHFRLAASGGIPLTEYSTGVILMYEVEYTDQFEGWWDDLTADEQVPVRAAVEQLVQFGPDPGIPPLLGDPWIALRIRSAAHGDSAHRGQKDW